MSSDKKVEFAFKNHDGFEVFEGTDGAFHIRVYRRTRTKPFEGMRQPTPAGGIMGLETVISVKELGLDAVDLKYEIYREDRLVEFGHTDSNGDIQFGSPMTDGVNYKIILFEQSYSMDWDESKLS